MLLKIKNFMCYREAAVDLPAGRVALFTGPNASGKSTVLDAFEWSLFGVARGYAKQNESAALKGDPANPMSVSVETKSEWEGWPRAIGRASKQTILPVEAADGFKANSDRFRSILGTWSLINAGDNARASLLNVICRAGATDEDILAEIKKAGAPVPPVGEYNGVKWSEFGDVPTTLKRAEEIRRGYHAAKSGAVPPEIQERLDNAKKELLELPSLEKPAEIAPGITQQEADALSSRILREQSQIKFLADHLVELLQRLSAYAPAQEIVEKYRLECCASRKESLDKEIEVLGMRWDEAKVTIDAYNEASKAFDKNFKDRARLTKLVATTEQDIASIQTNAGNAKARWDSWNKVVGVLAPDGPVAAAVLERAASGIDRERLKWASATLGVEIILGNDGSVKIGSRAPNVSSKAQNLLAGLALQDALCLAGGVPFLLVDELDVLHGDNLARGLKFLGEIAGDYEAVLAAYTGGKIAGLPGTFAQYACESGRLRLF